MPKVPCKHCGQLISVSTIDFKNNTCPDYCSNKKCKKGRVGKMTKKENYFQDMEETTKDVKKGRKSLFGNEDS